MDKAVQVTTGCQTKEERKRVRKNIGTLRSLTVQPKTKERYNASLEQFFSYLKDSFDCLYAEGGRMMSVGLHCRLAGRPGRAMALKRFLDYAASHDGVWFPRRIDIARHWQATHPPVAAPRPSEMERAAFVGAYGGIFEHSPWIAEGAYALELGAAHDSAAGLHNALARVFRAADDARKLEVLTAHPDLAGKLAAARRLTADSTAEQASAGLDALTDADRAEFTRLNAAYTEKFGFPFIIAVRDHDKPGILAAFTRRIENDRATEFAEACRQVERIACLRLTEILP